MATENYSATITMNLQYGLCDSVRTLPSLNVIGLSSGP